MLWLLDNPDRGISAVAGITVGVAGAVVAAGVSAGGATGAGGVTLPLASD